MQLQLRLGIESYRFADFYFALNHFVIFICLVIIFRNNADFQYRKVKKEELTLVFEYNILKLKFKNLDSNFGTLIDVDQSNYEAYEIHFHTPGTSYKEIL